MSALSIANDLFTIRPHELPIRLKEWPNTLDNGGKFTFAVGRQNNTDQVVEEDMGRAWTLFQSLLSLDGTSKETLFHENGGYFLVTCTVKDKTHALDVWHFVLENKFMSLEALKSGTFGKQRELAVELAAKFDLERGGR